VSTPLDVLNMIAQLRADLATARAEIQRLEKQWDEHCAFHGGESPHALNAALYRASDAESHCKALAEDVSRLRADLATVKAEHARVIASWKSEELDWIAERAAHAESEARYKTLQNHLMETEGKFWDV